MNIKITEQVNETVHPQGVYIFTLDDATRLKDLVTLMHKRDLANGVNTVNILLDVLSNSYTGQV
jgi:hypothetical protein